MLGKEASTLYGPVASWRFGQSLGVDLLYQRSICSFNCIYCQLGNIMDVRIERGIFVPTSKVIEDLKEINMTNIDVVTFSGNGEPTLALNLAEVASYIKKHFKKPIHILTNSSLFDNLEVREELKMFDLISAKLDAASQDIFERINRPHPVLKIKNIIEGLKALRKEYSNELHIQIMFMMVNKHQAESIAKVVAEIEPDMVDINTPTRPHAIKWHIDARKARPPYSYQAQKVKHLSAEEIREIVNIFREILPKKVGIKSVLNKLTNNS